MNKIFASDLVQRHSAATSIISAALDKNRLGHAYLLTGRAHEDKWSLSRFVAMQLNCQRIVGGQVSACQLMSGQIIKDHCVNCKWIDEGKHPQAWLTLTKEGSKSGKITVEKARLLSDELAKRSEFFRVAIIEDASQEAFHRPAANALLKTIENPGERCLFFLFAVREEDVLPTVVSRCQVVPMQNSHVQPSSLAVAVLKTGKSSTASISAQLEALRPHFERTFTARDSLETIRALEFARQLQTTTEAADEDDDASAVIDFAVNLEIERLGEAAASEGTTAGYLTDLLSLAESAKLQIDHYVSQKAAIETFVLSWWQLRKAARC